MTRNLPGPAAGIWSGGVVASTSAAYHWPRSPWVAL